MILCHTFGRSFLLYTLKLVENFLSKSKGPSCTQQGAFTTSELLTLEQVHNSQRWNWLTSCLTVTKILQHYLPFLSQVHLAVFYLQGKFYHVAKRLTGTEYVLVRKWYANQNEGSKRNMNYLMWMSLVNLMLTAVHDYMSFVASQEQIESTFKHEPTRKDDDPEIEPSKKCSLCLELRKNSSVTPCGHLYCWNCIIDWLRTKQECPICREKVLPSRIVALGNYLWYYKLFSTILKSYLSSFSTSKLAFAKNSHNSVIVWTDPCQNNSS